MTKRRFATTRRTVLEGAVAGAALLGAPALLRAQQGPVVMAALNPLTGAGGNYGPGMLQTIQAAVQAANGAGGIQGCEIRLVSEDGQTARRRRYAPRASSPTSTRRSRSWALGPRP